MMKITVMVVASLIMGMLIPVVQAEPSLPYTIYGKVVDTEGNNISGATIIIERIQTGETNLKNADGTPKTTTEAPVREDLETNAEGNFIFQLLTLSTFEDGDTFRVTATKGEQSATKIITIDLDGDHRDYVKITLGTAIPISLILLLILIIIIILLIVGIKKKRSG